MSCESHVIRVDNLSKSYQIYDSPRERLMQFLMPRLQRLLGRQPHRYHRDFHALAGVSFKVGKGETVGIIGRNGSGKSTLLQMICGTLTPSAGAVETCGRIAALLELGAGFNPEFTGRENVYLNGTLLGLTTREIDERYQAIAAFAGIGKFIDQPIKTYSSGMVVRLAFATAIHVDPDVLVVDEALAVGDTAFQQKCLHRIRQMQRQGVSILLVTHSANTLIEYCDRGIYLRHGELMMDGACRDVVKAYSDDLLEEEGAITLPRVGEASPEPVCETSLVESMAGPAPRDDHPMWIESARIVDQEGRPLASVAYGERVFARFVVQVTREIAEPCFGVQISSPDGIALWSATTQSMDLKLPALPAGRYSFTWELRADFSGNRYVLAFGAGQLNDGEYKRLHRLDYAGHFDVLPVPHSGAGWLAPHPRFSEAAAVSVGVG